MEIKENWHPIFQFLFELFKDLPAHFKTFYHRETELEIVINSYLEDQVRMNITLGKRVSLEGFEKLKPGEIIEISEEWWLNFGDGSGSCQQRVSFKSFTVGATKTTEGKKGPYSAEQCNDGDWTWMRDQLDFVLKIIKESKRIHPYTGQILTTEEAQKFDNIMSGRITYVEDFGAKLNKNLNKRL